MKILVSGCACSGTVLLTRLMFAFEEVRREVGTTSNNGYVMQMLTDKIARLPDKKSWCLKGSRKQVLSGDLKEEELDRQYELLKDAKVKVPFIVRYPPDVMSSAKTNGIFYHLKGLWLTLARQWEKYKDIISTTVRFEDILLRPDETQKRIAEDMGLTIAHPFSRYPRFLKPEWIESQKLTHSPRPLDPSKLSKPRGYGLNGGKAWIECYPPKERKEVMRYLGIFGYETN